jgi:hypothetical protein
MLVKTDEAKKMYCPFEFSKPAGKELMQINAPCPEGTLEP